MKYRLIKQKAVFQIFLIISLSLYSSLSFASLNNNENKINYFDLVGQDLFPSADAASKVCCELTKQDSIYKGSSCVYTEEVNCDPSKQKLSVACAQTDYCSAGVCKLKGTCSDNVERGICLQQGGVWNKGKSADDPQCKVGCCDLPSGASITTQAQCADKVQQFPDVKLEDTFKPQITDQSQCLQQSRGNEEGCCVITSENQCKFGTRKECSDLSGEFQGNGVLCSTPGLNCQVTAKHSTLCYQNKVYWADSARNRENVYDGNFNPNWEYTNWLQVNDPDQIDNLAKRNPQTLQEVAVSGNCQFSLGTTCGEVTDGVKNYLRTNKNLQPNDLGKVKNQCISLNCVNTKKNSNIAWMDGRTRQNGESWCEYQSKTGNGEDLVGSRQFIHICDNGIERVEECAERRKEICAQNDVPGNLVDPSNPNQKPLTYAKCVPNNWQLCLAANADNENCGVSLNDAKSQYNSIYSSVRDSSGDIKFGGPCTDSDNQDSCVMKTICRKKTCEDQVLGNCYFNTNVGLCAPAVPPGSLGQESEFKDLVNDNLGFSFEGKMVLAETSALGANPEFKEDCAAGCDLDTSSFANNWNSYCTSLGDLGAKYNVAGYYSKLGLYHGGPFNQNGDVDFESDGSAKGTTTLQSFNYYTSNIKPISGNLYALISNIENLKVINFEQLKDPNFLPGFFENLGVWVTSLTGIGAGILIANTLGAGIIIAGTGGSILFAISSKLQLIASLGPAAGPFIVAVLAVAIIYSLLSWAFGPEQSDLTYKLTCSPWVPKDKGQDCKICNDKSKFPNCDEYLCKSLGKACELLNADSPGQETCVWKNPSDTIPPIIAPLTIPPFTDNDIQKIPPSTGFTGGYKFLRNITAFTSVEIGIKILDEKAQQDFAECKISRFNEFDYDDANAQFFESSDTKSEHRRRLGVSQSPILPSEDRIELEAGKVNTFYIKCKDANGNENVKPYFIEIPVTKGPDTASPEIKSFSIRNNAFIPYNLNRTSFTIYVEDQSGLENSTTNSTNGLDGGCRYSTIKRQDYELMTNEMTCSRGKVNIDQYACTTTLNLKPNQENTFYFKCRDVQGNTNPLDSPPVEGDNTDGYHLFGSNPLSISQVGPSGDVLTTEVKLTLTTNEGAENGKSICYYAGGEKSNVQNLGDLTFSPSGIKFTTTDSSNHETTLDTLNEKDYLFYVWCRDVAGNEDSTKLEFHTTTPNLNITNVIPDNTRLYSNKVQLQVTTVGGTRGNGDADCTYKSVGTLYGGTGNINDYRTRTQLETTNYKNITLSDGSYEFEIECVDNVIYKSDKKRINFEVDVGGKPKIIRVFKEGGLLNVVTDRTSECQYSPTESKFTFGQGTLMVTTNSLQHSLQIANSKVFYIKCQDINTKQIGPDTSNSFNVYP